MKPTTESRKPQPLERLRRWCIRVLIAGALAILGGALVVGGVLLYFQAGLPAFASLADYHPPQVTRLVDRNGSVVAELFDEKRTVVSFDRIPQVVRNAFLAAEDADFYRHKGMDLAGLLRASLVNLRAGRVVQGGSTITQQVIKTFLLGPERSYSRKIRELLLALRLESNLTKDEILALYLNQIYFGHSCYGIQEASRFNFDKDVSDLGLAEAALLAALPKSPRGYSPIRHPDRARERRDWVLEQMARKGLATPDEVARAKTEELGVVGRAPDFFGLAPYYSEHCRRVLEDALGRDELVRGGLRVELALDLKLQREAQRAISDGLRAVDRHQGYRGPLGRLELSQLEGLKRSTFAGKASDDCWSLRPPGVDSDQPWRAEALVPTVGCRLLVPVVAIDGKGKEAVARVDLGSQFGLLDREAVRWARPFDPLGAGRAPESVVEVLQVGDVVEIAIDALEKGKPRISLSQPPLVQGALVAIDPSNRHVLAMVGGSDFRLSPLVRAVQSARQPGSAFKPVLYAAAIHSRSYTPTSVVMDTPEVYRVGVGRKAWKPANFEGEFSGPVTLRHALAHSTNTVAVKLASDLGPQTIVDMARSLGIASPLEPNLSLALGTSEVTPLELTNAYTTLAAEGVVSAPIFITRIVDSNGHQLPWEVDPPHQALVPAEAYLITSMLRTVVEEGTGRRAQGLDRPVAGKTGTTNGQRDGWFVGYTPDMACGVWVGFDDHRRLGLSWAQGAGTALPIWTNFMERGLRDLPHRDFRAPADVVFVRVDPENGLLAAPRLPGARFEPFLAGTEPRATSNREVTPETGTAKDVPTAGSSFHLPEELFQ